MKIINNTEEWKRRDRNLFGECEKVLDILKEERIFAIMYAEEDKRFSIYEKCDGYFGTRLTLDMCNDLAELFSKIAKKIEEDGIA